MTLRFYRFESPYTAVVECRKKMEDIQAVYRKNEVMFVSPARFVGVMPCFLSWHKVNVMYVDKHMEYH